jgi:hypothetical protein
LQFGFWCEIEGLGKKVLLNVAHPEFSAAWNGEPSGYVCFGNPGAQEWAYLVLCHLVSENKCDWIKLDFNVDPAAGCNRSDHGHGKGVGYSNITRVITGCLTASGKPSRTSFWKIALLAAYGLTWAWCVTPTLRS